MKVILEQNEIEQAVSEHLERAGLTQNLHNIEFTISRNPTSISAEVEMYRGPAEGKTIAASAEMRLVSDETETVTPIEDEADIDTEEESSDNASESLFG